MSISSEIQKMVQSASGTSKHRATVLRTDNDGTTWVSIPGGADETFLHGNLVEYQPGDEIEVTIDGGRAVATGNASEPSVGMRSVGAAVGPVRETAESAAAASAVAERVAAEAQAVADATAQHFFADDNGAHVTDVTQDEWNDAVDDGFSDYDPDTKPYHNQLLNSLGILLRSALNNLVSITRSAIAFFDGQGNNPENIVARFGSDGAQIGPETEAHATITNSGMTYTDQRGLAGFHVDTSADVVRQDNVPAYFRYDVFGRTNIWVGRRERGTSGVYVTSQERSYGFVPHPEVFNVPVASIASGGAFVVAYELSSIGGGDSGTITFTGGTAQTVSIVHNSTTYATLAYDGVKTLTLTAVESIDPPAEWCVLVDSAEADVLFYGASYTFGSRLEGRDVGDFSSASGFNVVASGFASHAQNQGTIAASDNQTAIGKFNVEDSNGDYALILGNGTSDYNRSNAFTIDWDGNGEFAGDVSCEEYQTHDNEHSFASPTASGNVYGNTWGCYDSQGTQVGYAQVANTPTGVYRSFAVRNQRSGAAGNVAIYLYSNDDGTMDANLTAGCTWRADDIPDGMPAAKIASSSTTTPSSIISPDSNNVTLGGAQYVQWGRIAMVNIWFTLKSALSTGSGNISNIHVGDIVSGKRPAINYTAVIPEQGGMVGINVNGSVSIGNFLPNLTIPTTTTLYIRGTYILA